MSTIVKHYAWPFVGLLVLTTLALGTSLLSLGSIEIPIGIAIAIGKTLLVAIFFMHLLEHRTSSALTLVVAVILLALLIGLSMLDVATRIAPGPVVNALGGPS
jgi:cytochrome c oxidase subunit 4